MLLWLLIKPMGIIGVALAWTIRVGLDTCLLFWLARRLFPKQTRLPEAQNKGFYYLGLIGLMAGGSALALLSSLAGKIIFLPIIIMLFCIWGWRYTLDNAEREEAIILLGRFRRLLLRQGDVHG